MKIGIVGAENSHCAAVARTLNVDKACGRARVVAVWGETRAFAEKAAEAAQIPEIVRRPEDMIGRIDGVMIDHRHAKHHIPAAVPFVEAGIPAFVDKPFSWTVAEGWKLLQRARAKGVPVTSFSVLPEQEAFKKDLLKQIKAAGIITAVETSGACDLKSKYGGIFFYGIHQIDAILKAFGPGIGAVQVIKASRGNPNAVAVMTYRDGGPVVSMACVAAGKAGFTFRAVGTEGAVDFQHRYDANPYLTGIRKFVRMFRTGKEPHTAAEILEPIAVLDALARSIKSGQRVNVRRLPNP
ncbi:MAG: Gfo/Idh/MocA family oxidoreductase [Candidatus Brocadiae bacterium]|nr:Gfo/Idh/MocA family oxidoreductase [Candidatus Brocadiia bacterium]